MSRLRLLNPFRIRNAYRQARRIASGGGPKSARLVGVGAPEGWIVPTARVSVDVKARDGTTQRFEPDLPVPWPAALAYRAGRRLLPLARRYF